MTLFGDDIALENGDIQISNSGDIITVSESDNFTQAIKNILSTETGTLYYDTFYGVNMSNIIGQKNTQLKILQLATSIKKALLRDPRVKSVDQINIVPDSNFPSQLNISLIINPISGQIPIGVNYVFPFVPFFVESNTVLGEIATSTTSKLIQVQYSIYSVSGVYLLNDTNKETNYFVGGYVDGNKIYLGIDLPAQKTDVVVDYKTVDSLRNNGINIQEKFDEKISTLNGITLKTEYKIYSIIGIYLFEDIQKTTKIDYQLTNKDEILLSTPYSINTEFVVDYAYFKE